MNPNFKKLASKLKGRIVPDELLRTLYATDASVYREMPVAVAFPDNTEDVKILIEFARKNGLSLIPRTAGTSLAGQVVGNGIIVDVSKSFTRILEVDETRQWVRVQPGVVRDELNLFLANHGLFFGPETSTSNRAMIGGMVGNNSSGSNSLIYGSTRDNILEVKGFLSDGSPVVFGSLSNDAFHAKCDAVDGSLENAIYCHIRETFGDKGIRDEIEKEFPRSSIKRRNTGYAIDDIAHSAPFIADGPDVNLARLIAGSEGTLMFITEVKLQCSPLPPKNKGLLCVHFKSVDEALRANLIALKYRPTACELMDDFILNCTKNNIEHRQNRFFLKGEPRALLVVELARHSMQEVEKEANALVGELIDTGFGYHYPLVTGDDIKKVWSLRKAALGLLYTTPGDAKPVAVVEDTTVDVHDLPSYVSEFNEIADSLGLSCVQYGHAGSGELHFRPVIDLKTARGLGLFRSIAEEIAILVKKHKGSLSGEHGDGRLRGEFIRNMVGDKNYELLKEIKHTWDPHQVFNPGKIVNAPAMDTSLRYWPGMVTPEIDTVFDFSSVQGYVRAAEFCNGTGDCRKTHLSGGTMCPSYMATRDENDTTRARANILREYLRKPFVKNRFNHDEIYQVMDLCLSCKACKSECPSNVDVAKLKAEFLQHYYEANGVPFRTRVIAGFSKLNALAAIFPGVYNYFVTNGFFSGLIQRIVGFAPKRSMPLLQSVTFAKWFRHYSGNHAANPGSTGKVCLFNDEFTNYNDTEIGKKAVLLLENLGYEVIVPAHIESGRASLSKGLLKKAREIAVRNVELLKNVISKDVPLVGIEPSAILAFRDEYIDLVPENMKATARSLAENALLFDEFIAREAGLGHISSDYFVLDAQKIKLHGHCHQKALASMKSTVEMLSIPRNYVVEEIPSGCCGMAGSFGYEKEHYDVSMKIGELVLFPAIRQKEKNTVIAAPGTSCRHQIKDGTGETALHPIEILYDALNKAWGNDQ